MAIVFDDRMLYYAVIGGMSIVEKIASGNTPTKFDVEWLYTSLSSLQILKYIDEFGSIVRPADEKNVADIIYEYLINKLQSDIIVNTDFKATIEYETNSPDAYVQRWAKRFPLPVLMIKNSVDSVTTDVNFFDWIKAHIDFIVDKIVSTFNANNATCCTGWRFTDGSQIQCETIDNKIAMAMAILYLHRILPNGEHIDKVNAWLNRISSCNWWDGSDSSCYTDTYTSCYRCDSTMKTAIWLSLALGNTNAFNNLLNMVKQSYTSKCGCGLADGQASIDYIFGVMLKNNGVNVNLDKQYNISVVSEQYSVGLYDYHILLGLSSLDIENKVYKVKAPVIIIDRNGNIDYEQTGEVSIPIIDNKIIITRVSA